VESSSEVHKYESDSAIGKGNPRFTRAGRSEIVPSHTPARLQDGGSREAPIFSIGRRNPLRSA
jgi:hypothetical protein